MENYYKKTREHIKPPQDLIDFFNEIDAVCKKYNLSISHQDGHGAFEIEAYEEFYMNWLRHAHINYEIIANYLDIVGYKKL
jgi:hypothetical protein